MKGHTVRLLLAGLAGAVVLACAGSSATVSDEEVSLRRESLQELTQSMAPQFAAPEPGGNPRFERAYYGAPPMVPHAVEVGSVTAGGNDCLDCHEISDEETPGIPPTHRLKSLFAVLPRDRAQDGMITVWERFAKADVVAGNRYDCTLCHAPQATNATALVGNSFSAPEPAGDMPDDIEGLPSVGEY